MHLGCCWSHNAGQRIRKPPAEGMTPAASHLHASKIVADCLDVDRPLFIQCVDCWNRSLGPAADYSIMAYLARTALFPLLQEASATLQGREIKLKA